MEEADERGAGSSGQTLPAEQPVDRTDTAGAELKHPPPKKTALEDLLGGTFAEPEPVQPISGIEAEMDKYRTETAISLTGCPLKWWKQKC